MNEDQLLFDLYSHPGWTVLEARWKRELSEIVAATMDPRVGQDETNFKKGCYVMLEAKITEAKEFRNQYLTKEG